MTKTEEESDDNSKSRRFHNEFVKEFKDESDRAAVILGASKIDQMLYMILEKYLVPCSVSKDELFDNNGPLGTFSSKINMCHRLAIIDDGFCRSIHMVRKIRNTFAHEVYGASLNSGSHKDRIKSLVAPIENHKESYQWLKKKYFHDIGDSRADFSTALGLIIARLEGTLNKIESLENDKARSLLPKDT